VRTPLPPLQTFIDDPLRVLRVIRFASRFNYSISPEIYDSLKNKDIHVIFQHLT
jgi:tRNA nucleotidyltransferase (CCA-adding enzyme)